MNLFFLIKYQLIVVYVVLGTIVAPFVFSSSLNSSSSFEKQEDTNKLLNEKQNTNKLKITSIFSDFPKNSSNRIKDRIEVYYGFKFKQLRNNSLATNCFYQTYLKNKGDRYLAIEAARMYIISQYNYDKAEEIMTTLVYTKPEDIDNHIALYNFYNIYQKKNNFEKLSNEVAENIFYKFYHDIRAVKFYINILIQKRERKQAIKILDEIIEINKKNKSFLFELVDISSQLISRDHKTYTKLIDYLENMSPSEIYIIEKISDYYLEKTHYEKAIFYYKKILEKSNKSLEVRHKLFRAYDNAGKVDLAIKELENIVQINPYDFYKTLLLASSYIEIKDVKNAAKYYLKAFNISIASDNEYLTAIENLVKFGYDQEAYKIAKLAYLYNSENLDIINELGIRSYIIGEYKESFNLLQILEKKIEQIDRAEVKENYLNVETYLTLAKSSEYLKKLLKAEIYYEKAYNLADEIQPDILNRLASMWMRNGKNIDQAGELLKQAIKIDSENIEIQNNLGFYYNLKGDYITSLEYYIKSMQKYIDNFESGKSNNKFPKEFLKQISSTYKKLNNLELAKYYSDLMDSTDKLPNNQKLEKIVKRKNSKDTENNERTKYSLKTNEINSKTNKKENYK